MSDTDGRSGQGLPGPPETSGDAERPDQGPTAFDRGLLLVDLSRNRPAHGHRGSRPPLTFGLQDSQDKLGKGGRLEEAETDAMLPQFGRTPATECPPTGRLAHLVVQLRPPDSTNPVAEPDELGRI